MSEVHDYGTVLRSAALLWGVTATASEGAH